MSRWLCCTCPTDQPPMNLRNFCPNMFHMSRRTIQEEIIWRSSLQGDRQGLRAPNTFPMQFKGYATGSKTGSSRSRWNRGTEYYPVGMKNHIEYPYIYIFLNIIVLTTLKWAPTFSSIYYEQVALLHPPNQLTSDETEEFLPKHVPHVQKDHIGKIHLALMPVG